MSCKPHCQITHRPLLSDPPPIDQGLSFTERNEARTTYELHSARLAVVHRALRDTVILPVLGLAALGTVLLTHFTR